MMPCFPLRRLISRPTRAPVWLPILAIALAAIIATERGVYAEDAQATKPGGTEPAVDFAHEIVPILQKRCAKCHAGTQRKGGFSINTRQTLISGGDEGTAAVPKDSGHSTLIARVTSDDSGVRMPPEGERLSAAQVALLSRWIDAGLPWEDGFAFGKLTRQAPLSPRRPAVPQGEEVSRLSNPIDRFLHDYFASHPPADRGVVSDAVFARRAAWDLIGLPLPPKELAAFIADSQPDKRERLIDRLLSDRAAYAAHWLTFWNDLLRNAYHGTGFIDGGRKQITGWLYGALYDNLPYDRFVRELIQPSARSGNEGFIYGIKWRGTVNESQRREIQAAQSVAQVFLGTNLKCASCHDSFVNHWKLTDAYAFASIFAEVPLELHRCDQPTGVPAQVGFLYPQLGTINAQAGPDERLGQLAQLLTHSDNGRTTRTVVNRLWAKLFGRGLVEPLDNMDAEPWHQDLLDYLASDLADHGYDLKRTLRFMATSQAYQSPGSAGTTSANGEAFVFDGPAVKRITAEQFVDAVLLLTNGWSTFDATLFRRDGRGQGGQLGEIAAVLAARDTALTTTECWPLMTARWIWSNADAHRQAPPGTLYLRRTWQLERRPPLALATFTADDALELMVNGKVVSKSASANSPVVQVDITDALKVGPNIIAVKATNGGNDPNPAGVLGEVFALEADGRPGPRLVTDASWLCSDVAVDDWLKPEFDDSPWKSAAESGDAGSEPWNVAGKINSGEAGVRAHPILPENFRIRAALLPLDPLQAALGRPSREQIVSSRDSQPTMLQALQLTNGTALREHLARGAQRRFAEGVQDPGEFVERLYRLGLGRAPSDDERRVALEIVGTTPDAESVEDLLWTICMLPEFQLVP